MIKNFTLILIFVFMLNFSAYAQSITWDYTGGNPTTVVPSELKQDDVLLLTVSTIADASEFDDFVQNSSVQVDAGAVKTLEAALQSHLGTDYAAFQAAFTISDLSLLDFLDTPLQKGNVVNLILKDVAGVNTFQIAYKEEEEDVIESSGDLPTEIEQWLESATISFGEGDEKTIADIYRDQDRYDNSNDRAFLFVDENGSLIGNAPVNIDQDDIIYVIVIGKKATVDKFNVDFVGSYAPVDLQMRSFEPVAAAFKQNSLARTYRVKIFRRGPFTSESVSIKIKKGKSVAATYSLRVNKLFNLGFGVGINISDLQSPEYELSPLSDTENTIIEKNAGKRTIFSFNVIWYWRSTYRYLVPGSHITRGRDVLKEPSFWERINPSFGFSLDSDFSQNLFFAGNFEFARGGTINIGYHWGKVTRLNIPNFELGQTTFSGSNIPLSEVWDGRFFIGIMLDTRIFNQLFAGAN
jgi:hypothetical protein